MDFGIEYPHACLGRISTTVDAFSYSRNSWTRDSFSLVMAVVQPNVVA
jgi:hypothetical protein